VEVADDRLAQLVVAAGAEMPLQVADPQHQVGDRRGSRVDFDAQKLVRVDRQQHLLAVAKSRSAFRTSPSSRFISSSET